MSIFRRLSIRGRLRLMMMLTCIVALALSTATIVGLGIIHEIGEIEHRLTQVASLLAHSASDVLDFNEEMKGQKILNSLADTPDVLVGALYGKDGKQLVSYTRDGTTRRPPEMPPQTGFHLATLELVRPVRNIREEEVGKIYLRSDLAAERRLLWKFLVGACGSFLFASLAAWLIANRYQRLFTAPILQLVQTAKTIALRKDYGLRAKPVVDDELGQLVDGFNEMLEQIDARDQKLRRHQDELEDQVRERTKELTQLNQDLKLAKERADQANEAKSTFLANMSHEIRTPLNAILGFSELLNGVAKDPREKAYIGSISSSGKGLLTIINDILDLSKIEAGRLELSSEPVSIRQLLTEVAQVFSQKVAEKKLRIELLPAPDLPESILFDEVRLRQILFNVVGNAVKFTNQGAIKISAFSRPAPSDPGKVNLLLEVEDTGIGIPAGELKRIFDSFSQVSGQSTRQYGGTGLGLTITKRLTEILGGAVYVESQSGVGSKFRFEFPGVTVATAAQTLSSADQPVLSLGQFRPGTILVAEDNEINRDLLSAFFAETGHRLLMAANGREAIDLAHCEKPDLVLMDIQMPKIDGWEAIRLMRNDPLLKTVPIIIVTAASGPEPDAQEETLHDGFLRKPVSLADLVEVMARFFPRAQTTVESNMNQADAATSPAGRRSLAPVELLLLLDGQLKEVWPGLRERPNIAQIEKFALRLTAWAETYRISELKEFALRLHQQAGLFELNQLAETLGQFPELIRSLTPQPDES